MSTRLRTSVFSALPLLFVLPLTACESPFGEEDPCDAAGACEVEGADLGLDAEVLNGEFDEAAGAYVFAPGEMARVRFTITSRGTLDSTEPATLYSDANTAQLISSLKPGEREHVTIVFPLGSDDPTELRAWIAYVHPDSNLPAFGIDANPQNDNAVVAVRVRP